MNLNLVKKSTFVMTGVISLAILSGCLSEGKKSKEQSLLVVNVLSKELYDDCHIPGSIHVDFARVLDAAKEWSKSAKIVVYCANYACTASASAVRSLKAEGFDAYEYGAGMAGWLQDGLPVEGKAESPYLRQSNVQHADAQHDVPVVTTQELKQLLDKQQA